ncbi:MAG: hypothetical protein ACK5MQ_18175 [Pikeienuella sp.]
MHPIAGGLAFLTIVSFWLSTVISELFTDAATVAAVKTTIPWGFLLLVPALALTGISGARLSLRRRGPLVERKKKRMPIIAANGILVLIPSALYLSARAQAGDFDAAFYAVQALELTAGLANITLLGLSMRDGMRLGGGKRGARRFAT